MKVVHRDILKHSSVYALGEALTRCASLILLPLYTRYLSPAEYGIIALLDLTAVILAVMIGSAFIAAAARFHFDDEHGGAQNAVWWTGLTCVLGASIVLITPCALFASRVETLVLGKNSIGGGGLVRIVMVTLAFNVICTFLYQHLRVHKKSGLYVTLSVSRLLLTIVLNVYLLVGREMGVQGVLIGNMLVSVLAAIVHVTIFIKMRSGYVFKKNYVAEYLKFGGPLILTALIATGMRQSDRYFIRSFLGLSEAGVYSLAAQFGTGLHLLMTFPFNQIWQVSMYEVAKQADSKPTYSRIFEYWVYIYGVAALAVSLFSTPVIRWLAGPDFHDAARYVPILCLSMLFLSFNIHFGVPFFLAKKTAFQLPASLFALGVNLSANWLLIPRFGGFGAAFASVITFGLYAFLLLFFARRVDRIEYPLAKVILTLVMMGVSFLCFQEFVGWGKNTLISIGWAILLVGCWTVLLLHPLVNQLKNKPDPEAIAVK